jgi:alpha-L-fucosidase
MMRRSKKKLRIYNVVIIIFLILVSYLISVDTTSLNDEKFEQTNNWLVLDRTDAEKEGTTYSWDIEVKNSLDYVVQIVLDSLPQGSSIAKIKIDDQEIKGFLKKKYTTYNSKIISEFKKPIKISGHLNKHVLTIETEENFDQIRIVPHYKNPIGSGIHHEEWLKMHESSEKKAALKSFKESKFGMFIHWGLYSQTGGIWKGVKINHSPIASPKVAEWLMHAFQIPREEYAELAKTFNPDKSFAQNIAKLAKQSGMKYVVITSKHHDGFALFDSKSSEYDMVDATPYKADAVKELYEACLAEGLDFGVYYSHGNDWNDGGDGNYANVKKVNDSLGVYTHPSGKNLWDPSPNTHAAYYESKSFPQIKELIALLPELKLIWFDGDGFTTEEQSFKFYKMIYNVNPNILVNRRVGWDFGDYLDAGDNKIPSAKEKLDKYWETCGTTNNSWGYKSYDDDWKSPKEMLYYFVDILSKGGNYLLNIGPDGKGHVPEASSKGLLEMGKWIATNGEAIYGTSRWKVSNEGQEETLLDGTGHRAAKGFKRDFTSKDFWFTTKDNKVYVISLTNTEGDILIKSLTEGEGDIEQVKLLGSEKNLSWDQNENGLQITITDIPKDALGYVIEVTLKHNYEN